MAFLVPEAALPGTPGALAWTECKKDRERRQLVVHWSAAGRQNGNPSYELFEKNTDRVRNWLKPYVLGRRAA